MSLTCNAVGDVLALIELAIQITTFILDYRDAPSECQALLEDLRSMERLLALAQPVIRAIQQDMLREVVTERLGVVAQRVQDGLNLVVKFRSALDTSPIQPRSEWRTTVIRWVTKTTERVVWALKRRMNAEACRIAIAQSFEPLLFALLLAHKADQDRLLSTIQRSLEELSKETSDAHQGFASGRDVLRGDVGLLIASHNKLRDALEVVQHEATHALDRFGRTIETIHVDTVHLRHDVQKLDSSTATLTYIVSDNFGNVHNSVSQVRDQVAAMQQMQHEQAEMLSQLLANPVLVAVCRVLAFCSYSPVEVSTSPDSNDDVTLSRQFRRAVASPLPMIGAFALALQGSSSVERAAWAGAAFSLFVANQLAHMYKTPVTIHIIFVKDFCDDTYEIPIIEAATLADLRRALTPRLVGRVGENLVKRRMYEVQWSSSSTRSEAKAFTDITSNQPLKPGDRLELNALVERTSDSRTVVCFACKLSITTVCMDGEPWIQCPACSARVRFSSRLMQAAGAKGSYRKKSRRNDGSDDWQLTLGETLRLCRRVRVVVTAIKEPSLLTRAERMQIAMRKKHQINTE